MADVQQGSRAVWADNAKFLAIFLVFLGHLLEAFYDSGKTSVLLPIKFCHAFFIPVFFIIVGIFAVPRDATITHSISRLFPRRIIPVLFFSLLVLPAHLLLNSDTQIIKEGPLAIGFFYLSGAPVLNWTTWFLVTLFSAEILFQLLGMKIQRPAVLLAIGACTYAIGWYISAKAPVAAYILLGFWFFREALVAVFFIIIGYVFKKPLLALLDKGRGYLYLALFVASLITLLTFDMNSFANKHVLDSRDTVVMSVSQHGHFLWYPLTAISGSLMLIVLAAIIPANRFMNFFGKNTLVLLGMAGFYLHFINEPVAAFVNAYLSAGQGQGFVIVALSIALTLLQIMLT